MAVIKGLTLLFVTFAFYNCSIIEATDCVLPWSSNNDAITHFTNHCPNIIGNQDKKYCCYTFKGEVDCCDLPQFIFFGVIVFIIFLMPFLFICCICSVFCKLICCR